MKHSILLAALLCASASANVIGIVDAGEGAQIRLHDEAGQCVAGAMRAEHITAAGVTTPGCWRVEGPQVVVAWWDADGSLIPLRAVKRPVVL